MTPTLLDFSLRPELGLHARVVADVEAVAAPMGIDTVITGAFARDLHLLYRYGIDMQRQTEDIDFGLAVSDWAAFDALRERLNATGVSRRQRPLRTACGTTTVCRLIWFRLAVSRRVIGPLPGHRVAMWS